MTRRTGATLIVATTHTDLAEDLSPSVTIRKGWGKEIKVDYTVNAEPTHCTITDKITIRESDKDEYHKLGHLHYRSPKVPVPLKYYAMLVGDELAGVIAYSYPITRSRGRKEAVGYAPEIKELNKSWALISRVIIHPKYRTIGLGAALVRETLPMVGRTHVELIAVMARYNPFAEKAGMKLILLTEPSPDLVRLVEELRNMGFNPALIGSRSYNRRILDTMNQEEREVLINIIHSIGYRYARRLARKDYYPRKAQFAEWLQQQDDVSLAYTIQTIGTLAQCKAYLYWRRPGE
jgi:GNAT superfamily N-acetyltransferase